MNKVLGSEWLGVSELSTFRKKPILWAVVAFIVYLFFVIVGTELQEAITDKLTMNWGQQILSLLAVLIFAFFHKNPKELLGISKPKQSWLGWTIILSFITILLGLLVSMVLKTPETLQNTEYYIYESLMPSLGEEIGLRGLFLGFLLHYVKQNELSKTKTWMILVLHAIPFGLLHLLEAKNIVEVSAVFSYTFFAAMALGWLRLRTASIIPCIVAHSIMNVFGNLIGYFILG